MADSWVVCASYTQIQKQELFRHFSEDTVIQAIQGHRSMLITLCTGLGDSTRTQCHRPGRETRFGEDGSWRKLPRIEVGAQRDAGK